MSLFKIAGESILAEAVEPEIATPLGTVATELIADGNEDRFEARETRFLPSGSYIVYGGGRLFEAELLVANARPPMPEHMTLAGCRAFVWRVRPNRQKIRNLRFAPRLAAESFSGRRRKARTDPV
ncbi:hypothetical protein QWJ34_12305 [Saccharibacillus sp. CPCC 101409]|uniref:hypothetical protein n=1 Tax=Saccharibacillus sp. CPCC 101409 TaxID=3058041 RepID=UPI002673ACF4|nr:hypothetical protein [Saccharibacillus sp. CPCC 101409]MDO3410545.1 hypothetical protein [Saccharibacillus sp. CPCC 101409]